MWLQADVGPWWEKSLQWFHAGTFCYKTWSQACLCADCIHGECGYFLYFTKCCHNMYTKVCQQRSQSKKKVMTSKTHDCNALDLVKNATFEFPDCGCSSSAPLPKLYANYVKPNMTKKLARTVVPTMFLITSTLYWTFGHFGKLFCDECIPILSTKLCQKTKRIPTKKTKKVKIF